MHREFHDAQPYSGGQCGAPTLDDYPSEEKSSHDNGLTLWGPIEAHLRQEQAREGFDARLEDL